MKSGFSVLWILVKRDYTLRYAGSFLGVVWMLLQNLTLILLYAFVFLYMNFKSANSQENYSQYVFSGLLFWIPIQEFLLHGTEVLSENRQLIKRSSLGVEIFLWIPYIQFLIHYILTSIPVGIILFYTGGLNVPGFLLGYFWMGFTGLYLLLFLNYLSRLNVILKDISPLVRLLSQILFWTMPVLYYPSGALGEINAYNPLNIALDVFRHLVLLDFTSPFQWVAILPFLALFFLVYYLSRKRFHRIILDHF